MLIEEGRYIAPDSENNIWSAEEARDWRIGWSIDDITDATERAALKTYDDPTLDL